MKKYLTFLLLIPTALLAAPEDTEQQLRHVAKPTGATSPNAELAYDENRKESDRYYRSAT
ncbi:Uncharacterised protein [Canicola haemoglobinophilus]|uniref:Uncharacterized protein n=1 Tax=Canicola haemoglobinophilus TaxID=733 RepID=A0A377HWH3_9PAST|nr:hypothetical protein [Canicola haemoglobinophilus]STO60693.1 Uncharacterised protein [Canicola haemoglobinophilus]